MVDDFDDVMDAFKNDSDGGFDDADFDDEALLVSL